MVVQSTQQAIALQFGNNEGKYTDAWKTFFTQIDSLQNKGKHEMASTVLGRVLKTLIWSADSVSAASLSNVPEHRDAYADVTRFIELWGDHAPQVAVTECGLKLEGESIANKIVKDVSKFKCHRCGNMGHLIASCYVSKQKKQFRTGPNTRKPERDDREDFDRPRGYGAGFGGKRGVSRDRGPVRR